VIGNFGGSLGVAPLGCRGTSGQRRLDDGASRCATLRRYVLRDATRCYATLRDSVLRDATRHHNKKIASGLDHLMLAHVDDTVI